MDSPPEHILKICSENRIPRDQCSTTDFIVQFLADDIQVYTLFYVNFKYSHSDFATVFNVICFCRALLK